jgi:palmitoyl-protein thioesterase
MLFFLFLLLTSVSSFNNISSLTDHDITSSNKLPVVLMHGILSNEEKMSDLKLYLETNFNIDVVVPEIGNGIGNSLSLPLSDQGDILCSNLNNNILLKDGFNFIGVSQGGLLGRYYIEKCGNYQVNNFITLVSPHGGVYIKSIADMIDVYGEYAQEHYSFSSYWRDPFNYDKYREIILLAELNNEAEIGIPISKNNRERFNSINNFIMVYSPTDEILKPPESGKFSTYAIDSLDVVNIEATTMYYNLGLDQMFKNNKIHIYETNCTHAQHKEYECFKYLHCMFEEYCS